MSRALGIAHECIKRLYLTILTDILRFLNLHGKKFRCPDVLTSIIESIILFIILYGFLPE
ncbi:hypothetical protein EKN56_00680 [Limnobaculum zhutongyuii]|uniref:Uncharacterized protein n=1 Tax=Limnobaculum zhutongyuii TaxID=2498113 RepID=A0A411WFH9_9GAMM|nr:hypothetical protein EKN56_00680 [Limnobaculum zhutongyuii]TQS87597.1 hypothetical protein ELQ32_13240 [Limnobaculum zhutongyuii]